MASLRRVRALLVGMVVAFVLTQVVENMVFRFFPAEEQSGEWTRETMSAYVTGLPDAAFILMIVGWCMCIFAGGMMACLVGLQHLAHMVGVVTMAVLAGSVANFAMVDYPSWVMISTVFAGLITGLLTYSLAERMGLDRERKEPKAAQAQGKKRKSERGKGSKK